MDKKQQNLPPHKTNNSTTQKVSRYFVVGIVLLIFNYSLYTIIASFINNPDSLWLSSFIANTFTIILAFILHSRITWKAKHITIITQLKFFIWNIITAQIIGPFLTQVFRLLTPVYNFAYNISTAIHLPFTYSYIQATGAFVFTSIISMIINYLFYDRFVFGQSKPRQSESTTTD